MTIKIPDSWLRDYIKTNATPKDIAHALSSHAFSVERIEKWPDDDSIYHIEVTPNRGDALSVMGIARELAAILPRVGFAAEPAKEITPPIPQPPRLNLQKPRRLFLGGVGELADSAKSALTVEIKDKSLVPRFSAIVISDVTVKQSPDLIKERLEKVGIRAIDSVVDVTNYLMIALGQPMHSFDYDKIKGGKMIVRESQKGEKIATLDGVTRTLPQGVIVIEDGEGRLIDLCGIMGGQNSEIDAKTKKVLLFVQIYDPVRIRRASMALGHRTDAAVRFEKGIDPEGVIPSLWEAARMIEENSGGKLASDLIDIVNQPYKPKTVPLEYEKIRRIAGIDIPDSEINNTLESLGFKIEGFREFTHPANSPTSEVKSAETSEVIPWRGDSLTAASAKIPSWRDSDIEITEDLAEEVIRIYGYHNLPGKLLTGEIPKEREDGSFYWEDKARDYLKYQGFFEIYTTSATSKALAKETPFGCGTEISTRRVGDLASLSVQPLRLSNPLSEEFAYLRTSLIPQLNEVLNKNKGYGDKIKLFELASVYLPQAGDLPNQPRRLALVTKGFGYLELKGIIEGLLCEMGIREASADSSTRRVENSVSHPTGVFSADALRMAGDDILAVELDFEALAQAATNAKTYTPISKFNAIKEDYTFVIPQGVTYQQIKTAIEQTDPRIAKVALKDHYQNCLTFAVEYLDREKQITSEETAKIREVLIKNLKESLEAHLK